MEYPISLPFSQKPVWFYEDNFPAERPLKLTSVFCHRSYSIDMHSHDFYEVNIIINGTGIHYTEKQQYPVGVGDVIVIPPKTYHGYYNLEHLDIFHILLHKNYINKYSSDLHALSSFHLLFHEDINLRNAQQIPQFHIQGKTYDDILEILYQLDYLEKETNRAPARADYLISYALCCALIVSLCKEYVKQYSTDETATEKPSDLGLLTVTEYIHTHYAQHITLNDLCRVSLMSKTQLCEKFKTYLGTTPLNYVNKYRILAAKNMIIETDKTVTEIAQDTGFFDVSHFLKTYARYETETPSSLRERLKRNLSKGM